MSFDLIDRKFARPSAPKCEPVEWNEGAPCPLCHVGTVEFAYPEDGCCSCHISPPCGYCTSSVHWCPACDTEEGEASDA
jgi:hypothetical protein